MAQRYLPMALLGGSSAGLPEDPVFVAVPSIRRAKVKVREMRWGRSGGTTSHGHSLVERIAIGTSAGSAAPVGSQLQSQLEQHEGGIKGSVEAGVIADESANTRRKPCLFAAYRPQGNVRSWPMSGRPHEGTSRSWATARRPEHSVANHVGECQPGLSPCNYRMGAIGPATQT